MKKMFIRDKYYSTAEDFDSYDVRKYVYMSMCN